MGLRFRKAIKAGPVRINLSKSGIGYSIGTKGLRYTKKANGGVRKTVSIPGTGISYVTETSGKTKSRTTSKTAASAAVSTAPTVSQVEAPKTTEKKKLPKGFWKMVGLWYLLVGVFGALARGILQLPDSPTVLVGIAGGSIATYLIFNRSKAKKKSKKPLIVPPDQLDNPDYFNDEPEDSGESPWRPGCSLTIVGLLVISLIGSCMGGNADETVPTEPSTTTAIIQTTAPTQEPTETTAAPTDPTDPETEAPTEEPTAAPTEAPTAPPATEPKPTQAPTAPPTEAPTEAPTTPPTEAPTTPPTEAPTTPPTVAPTAPPATDPPVPETTERKTRDYVLNTNTDKFHFPGCSEVKKIKDSNR